MDRKLTYVFYILLPLLTIGINIGYTVFPVCLLALFFRLLFTNKDTAGFYLLMFGGTFGGILRMSYPSVPVYGLLLMFIGVVLMRKHIVSFFKERKSSIVAMLAVIIVFFISYLYAEHTVYADEKMFLIVFHGSLMLWGYYVFFKSKEISTEHLCQLLLISTIAYITFLIRQYGLYVGSLGDYNWLRSQIVYFSYLNQEKTLISYQTIGMYALFGLSFFLSNPIMDKRKTILYLLIAFQLILLSGARQAILGFLVIVFFRLAYFNNTKSVSKIVYIILGAVISILFLRIILSSGSEAVSGAIESGGSGRDLIYLDTFRIISQNLFLGVGLGGFPLYTKIDDIAWPHNFILELLCETGLIGTIALLLIIAIYWLKTKVPLRVCTFTGNYYFLVVIALGIRVMISGDLTESVEIFSAILVVSSIKRIRYV